MVRIAGVDLQNNKRIDYALTKIYGVGWSLSEKILKTTNIDPATRTNDLSDETANKLTKIVETFKVEGDLKREIAENIKRLKEIGSYRGYRHSRNLPVRGQRTRSNARTKRGKRVTIGAIKKDMRVKVAPAAEAASKKVENK